MNKKEVRRGEKKKKQECRKGSKWRWKKRIMRSSNAEREVKGGGEKSIMRGRNVGKIMNCLIYTEGKK